MRILTNFSKKISTADFENETFTVTVECETEFNDVAEVADYLFQEAESAVSRQLPGYQGRGARRLQGGVQAAQSL